MRLRIAQLSLLLQARTSLLVFKGPANPSGRIRKPPSTILVDSAPKKSSTTVVRRKKKPAISLELSDEEGQEEVAVLSDKKKGKRKMMEEPVEAIRPLQSSKGKFSTLFRSTPYVR